MCLNCWPGRTQRRQQKGPPERPRSPESRLVVVSCGPLLLPWLLHCLLALLRVLKFHRPALLGELGHFELVFLARLFHFHADTIALGHLALALHLRVKRGLRLILLGVLRDLRGLDSGLRNLGLALLYGRLRLDLLALYLRVGPLRGLLRGL